jgi:PAS domain S-box-containing protein
MREEVVGHRFSEFLAPDWKDQFTEKFPLFKEAGEISGVEFNMVRKDGTFRILQFNGKIGHDEEGNFLQTHCIMHDITERKRTEATLRESEEKYRSLFENLPSAFAYHRIVLDEEGNPADYIFLEVNSSFERLTGLKRENILGKRVTEVLPGIKEAEFDWIGVYGKVALTGETIHFEQYAEPLDRWYAISAYRPEQNHFVAVFDEITDRKAAEEEIYLLNRELEERVRRRTAELASANKELETFAYSVSHDLRTPLRGMDGFSKILLEDYSEALDERGKDYLERVQAAAERMGSLIDDLLSLSRVSRAKLRRMHVNMTTMAESIAQDLKQNAPDRHIVFEIRPGMEVQGDPQLIGIVLENLLGNAWKFTGNCDDAKIEMGILDAEETLEMGYADKSVYFIRDNGAGFDMKYVEKLFGAFQRLHSTAEFPGTGIGLATVQRIIRRHGGKIWAKGDVDKGATFYFTLAV